MTDSTTDQSQTAAKSRQAGTKWTAEQKAVVAELAALQATLKLSNAQFVAQWLKGYTESAWSLAKSDNYGAKDNSRLFAAIEETLKRIKLVMRRNQSATQGGEYHEFPTFTAMFAAVEHCMVRKSENRLIVYVAPTGCGKSRFISELTLRTDVNLVRANETWHGSYFFAMLDVIRALKKDAADLEEPRSAKDGRAQMLAMMKGRVEVLAIDEGNYFGPRSINLVKDILNETMWPVVLTLTPAAWLKMQRYSHEFGQLRRRIYAVFEHQPLSAADAARFLSSAGLNGDRHLASVRLADGCNEFGGFDFSNRVLEILAERGDGGHPTLADVESAILLVQKQLGLSEK